MKNLPKLSGMTEMSYRRKQKMPTSYVVDYDYMDGGSFKQTFFERRDAIAFCRELADNRSVVWVQCLRGDVRHFPA
jgi:hypothetical protein